ncbi:hypothetical protein SerAS12_1106 [Serratia sp. AS12]|uniref:hypothetical protein n=1 Tax=Serratia TaxID=613 RepID=UPI00020E92B1|nr:MULTISPECIES: hypothetical protein [Serratia]AEF44253.1 hypothetical protein SerAS9_1106 [Serratia plymuthica AS9]AEF49205.1 hypothetical protein SerAS12_1106 [Serratia sp. AS12]AEG26912.1 hypothetical protein SerAS13_1106 [Serratia sp. AS13]UTN97780.1 hypothetical protein NLX81_05725 [Serratia plymuthica]
MSLNTTETQSRSGASLPTHMPLSPGGRLRSLDGGNDDLLPGDEFIDDVLATRQLLDTEL